MLLVRLLEYIYSAGPEVGWFNRKGQYRMFSMIYSFHSKVHLGFELINITNDQSVWAYRTNIEQGTSDIKHELEDFNSFLFLNLYM